MVNYILITSIGEKQILEAYLSLKSQSLYYNSYPGVIAATLTQSNHYQSK